MSRKKAPDSVGGFKVGDRIIYAKMPSAHDPDPLLGVIGTVTALEFPGTAVEMLRWVADEPSRRPSYRKKHLRGCAEGQDYWCSDPDELEHVDLARDYAVSWKKGARK